MHAIFTFRSALFWLLCSGIAIGSWRFVPLGVAASMEYVAYHAQMRPLAFFAHVGLAPVALLLMPLQFSSRLRAQRPELHRWVGRAYAAAILFSGLGGLLLALGTEAGPIASAGFALLAILWLGTTAAGVWKARAREFTAHRQWMIRSAALTFAAVTLRLELPLLIVGGLEFQAAYTAVAWLCWVPNLLMAEWMLTSGPRHVGALEG